MSFVIVEEVQVFVCGFPVKIIFTEESGRGVFMTS